MDDKKKAAGWIEDPEHHVKPTKPQSPVSIVLIGGMVDLSAGSIHGSLQLTPHYPSQAPIVQKLLDSPLRCAVNPDSAPGTVEFHIAPFVTSSQPNLPSGEDLDKVIAEKQVIIDAKEKHIEDLTRLIADLNQEVSSASGKPETAKADGDSGAQPK